MKAINLRDLQLEEFNILLEIDRICKKYNIKYFLNAGTLLGAIRHKGFIPWDDDIDICMPIKDYKKFKRIAKEELNNSFFLQSYDTDLTSIWYTKVRKNGTTAIETGCIEHSFHQGIWVDIFPIIGVKNDSHWLKSISKRAGFAKKLLKIKNGYIEAGKDLPIVKKLHKLVPLTIIRLFAKMIYALTFKSHDKYPHCYCVWGQKQFYAKYNSSLFNESCEVEFEGHIFPAPNNWDEYLSIEYGDYMTPPPPDKRKGGFHSLKIVDLEKDYKYYVKG